MRLSWCTLCLHTISKEPINRISQVNGVNLEMFKKQTGQISGFTRAYYSSLKSIVLLASEHDLDPKLLADAFFEALENKISYCGSLQLSCRKVNRDTAIFLIIKAGNVAWQFPVTLEILRNEAIRDSIKQIPLPEKVLNNDVGRSLKIRDLKPGMKKINAIVEIVEIPPARMVITRWGSEALVSQIKIADETGSVRMSLWNDQIKTVNIGDEVEITNCHISSFANETQVRLGRRSTISILNSHQADVIQHPIIN